MYLSKKSTGGVSSRNILEKKEKITIKTNFWVYKRTKKKTQCRRKMYHLIMAYSNCGAVFATATSNKNVTE